MIWARVLPPFAAVHSAALAPLTTLTGCIAALEWDPLTRDAGPVEVFGDANDANTYYQHGLRLLEEDPSCGTSVVSTRTRPSTGWASERNSTATCAGPTWGPGRQRGHRQRLRARRRRTRTAGEDRDRASRPTCTTAASQSVTIPDDPDAHQLLHHTLLSRIIQLRFGPTGLYHYLALHDPEVTAAASLIPNAAALRGGQ